MELVSAAERERYRSAGYFVREGVLGAAEVEPLRDAVEAVHRAIVRAASEEDARGSERVDERRYQRVLGSTVKWEWREGSAEIRSMEPFAHLDPRLDALIDDPRLWAPAADRIGAKPWLFTDKPHFKRPGGAPFPWHQDTPYWAFGCEHVDRLASLQLYLDDANVENGCLWMIPGSHADGPLPTFRDRGVLGRLYTDLDGIETAAPVPIEAPAGSLIFFDGNVVHGSQTNRSESSRRALVLTYQPPGHALWNRDETRPVAPSAS